MLQEDKAVSVGYLMRIGVLHEDMQIFDMTTNAQVGVVEVDGVEYFLYPESLIRAYELRIANYKLGENKK